MKYLVVGYGNIGAKRKAVLGERCVATVDPFNAEADYRSVTECDPARYDAAVLAVPNDVKVELLHYFLDRGKHVLVEKPLIIDPETASELARRARHSGAVWHTSYNFRFEPNVLALRRHLDRDVLGRLYRVRMFCGNGTAGNLVGTWRDSQYGVLEDMATHLIDLAGFVFRRFGCDFQVWARRGHEMKGIDHCILATADGGLVIECSFLSWKNRWRIEVIGERGMIEMDGLTKWGTSDLVLWTRKRPSGAPEEHRERVAGPDPTWAADFAYFEARAREGVTSHDNDVWLSRTVMAAASMPVGGAP
jgi:scyllo-inositol 2-dehydrogenase (NADP+)